METNCIRRSNFLHLPFGALHINCHLIIVAESSVSVYIIITFACKKQKKKNNLQHIIYRTDEPLEFSTAFINKCLFCICVRVFPLIFQT